MRVIIFHFLLIFISTVFCYDEIAKFEFDLKRTLKMYFNNSLETLDTSSFYLDFICNLNITRRNVSTSCAAQMDVVCNNSSVLSQMADAWSKLPYTGMLVSTRQDLGTFDQCIAVDHRPENGPRVLGKHCANGLAIPLSADDIYMLSYCVPDGCSALDLANMISIPLLPETIIQQLVNEIFCTTRESNKTLEPSTITVAALFGFFLGLMVLSTFYDIFLHNTQREHKTPFFTAFSVLTNGKKLAQTTVKHGPNSEQILVFHGIKVISMMWILAGHNAGMFSILPVVNHKEKEKFEYQRYSQYILTAHLAVDTFFYISGFLLAYQYFKGPAKRPVIVQVLSIPKMILHRYLRITPAVLMAYLYVVYLAHHIGNGPIFNRINDAISRPCRDHWWAFFLYIQNYYNPTDLCLVHSWYLSADWQLFLISPLILIPIAWQFRKWFKLVLVELLALNVFVMLLPLYTKLRFPDFDPNNLEYDTHSKLINYFMGITFGLYLRCQRHRPYAFRGVSNIIMWFFTIVIMFCTTAVLQEVNLHRGDIAKALCYTFMKPVWCLGLTFIIYSCTYGKGGIVNWFLSCGGMQVLSKLTFCMYIMHASVIIFWVATKRTKEYFSDFNLFFIWCGQFILTIVVAVLWTLAFESPIITIERFLLGGGRPKKAQDKSENKPKGPIEVIRKTPYEDENV